jgi:hypothetical protein
MKASLLIVFGICLFQIQLFAQDDSSEFSETEEEFIQETFLGTRIINGHSVETLEKGALEFRVEHRFGDIAGDQGGAQTMFGLDNSADIRIALEYGVTDALMIGFGRSKGSGEPYRSLLDGFAKYRILRQSESNGVPLSLSALTTSSFTYMEASEDLTLVSSFPEWQHRFAYSIQLNAARKFGERVSLAVLPTMVHRNLVAVDDVNTLFAIGGAARIGITDKMAILLEYYHVLSDPDFRTTNTNSLGVAFEWKTFGHNFTIHMTNSRGFGETQFIPSTYTDWMEGEFRLGFCISREFSF